MFSYLLMANKMHLYVPKYLGICLYKFLENRISPNNDIEKNFAENSTELQENDTTI